MRRAVFTVLAVLTAVVLQTSVLDRLPFPGGFPPNLVLVLVVTLALAGGPLAGTVIGFGAGLALDIAPPVAGLLGLNALVFCAIGYGCGRLRAPMERSAWLPLAVVAAATAVGEVLYALAGLTLGDPDITWQSMRQVLPPVIVYSILISPFVLYLVVRFSGFGGWATAGARGPGLLPAAEPGGLRLLGVPAASFAGLAATGAAVRDTHSGREPRLRPAGRGPDTWIGGRQAAPGQPSGAPVQRRRQLRLRGGVAGSAASGAVGAARAAAPGRPVHLRLGTSRRGDGRLAGSPGRGQLGLTGAARPGRAARLGRNAFRGQALPGAASRPSPGLQPGPGAFRGGPSAMARTGSTGRPARLRLRVRRRDGVLGGSVLGPGARGAGGGGVPGSAFVSRRPASPRRSGRGQGSVPRFRAGRGIFRLGGGGLPGGRRGSVRGSALASRQRRFGWNGWRLPGVLGGKPRRGGGLRLPGKRTGGQL
jgi:rod shape-determining protein MreD